MTAPLLVVTGTGTGIGKTHLAAALVLAWRRVLLEQGVADPQVAGLKPVETGVTLETTECDGTTLEHVSTFHVKRFPAPYLFARAVSPHLAARDAGATIDPAVVRAYVEDVRGRADAVVVELAGGLFSPLAPALSNADLARDLGAGVVLLVAPDRLGVLHEVSATSRAAAAVGVTLTGIVLVTPEHPDTSTGTNAAELKVVTDLPVLAVVPRADLRSLGEHPAVAAIAARCVRPRPL